MNAKSILVLIGFFFLFLGLNSCEKKRGCTDPDATNYDIDARQDNKSCEFGDVTFYTESLTRGDSTIAKIKVYINANDEENITDDVGELEEVITGTPICYLPTAVTFDNVTQSRSYSWRTELEFSGGGTLKDATFGKFAPSGECRVIKIYPK